MVNTEEFTKRLNQIMEHYDLTAAAFADKIEVGRSSISHLLSGRNKPSLDFVLKVIQQFPEVELYWLLNGKGTFPATAPEKSPSAPAEQPSLAPSSKQPDLFSEETAAPKSSFEGESRVAPGRKVAKVILFYEDGSFEVYEN